MKSKSINNDKILAVIPARGASRGLPRKNIKLMAGKPLIAYTIEDALKSNSLTNVIVSTDDENIADVSRKHGAEVIKRPDALAKDETATIDVIFHVLEDLEVKNLQPDIVILLQLTSPLRSIGDIDEAIKLFKCSDCDSVVSVCEMEHSPYWSFNIEGEYLEPIFGSIYLRMRRQDLPTAFLPNGAIYISTPQSLKNNASFYTDKTIPFLMPPQRSVDIDSELDFMLAELLIEKYKN
jgi:N-acylneuraminate cytidylyltransferase